LAGVDHQRLNFHQLTSERSCDGSAN